MYSSPTHLKRAHECEVDVDEDDVGGAQMTERALQLVALADDARHEPAWKTLPRSVERRTNMVGLPLDCLERGDSGGGHETVLDERVQRRLPARFLDALVLL